MPEQNGNTEAPELNGSPDFEGAANPGGTMDDDRLEIHKCSIEYLAKDENPAGFEKGLLSFANAQGPINQRREIKVNWLATRPLMKLATPYGETAKTLCASYDGIVPVLGEEQKPGPCSSIQDGKQRPVCDFALWKAICKEDASHQISHTGYKDCPVCHTKKIKRVPPECRQVFVGLFYVPETGKYITFWFWKSFEATLRDLFKQMKNRATEYLIPPNLIPVGFQLTLCVKSIRSYYVPHFPEVATDGTALWEKTSEEVMTKIKENWAEVTRIFEGIQFFGVVEGENTDDSDIPF